MTAQGVVKAATGKTLTSTMGAPNVESGTLDPKTQTLSVSPLISTPSTSLSWNSDAPISSFGKPDPFSTDLSSGGLTSSESINVPAGPGGLTPPVSLSYSSESVNEQHSYSSAAGWVGEGWNLSLGEISWNQHNVVAGCTPQPSCGSNWQNQWFFDDAYGTSSQLIPPNVTASTYYDASSNTACQLSNPSVPCPILWHTADESHDKIYAYVGPLTIPSESINPVCWRVWLPNGIMEEFGCTSDSLQYFYVQGGHAEVSGWFLDMITDPQGNQVHLTYQRDMENWTDPSTHTVYSYPRDVELQSVQYGSPGCLNAQAMCTGSSWAPQMQVVFNTGHTPTTLTGTAPTGCNTGTNLRCDDPLDLSGSGGTAAPLIQGTSVLNNIQVQVRTSGSGSWNTLSTYNLGYEQSGPTTITDPASGLKASVAGMLDLTQFQQVGSDGSTPLPMVTFAYTSLTNYYVDSFFVPNPSTNCGPSWNTGNGSGCLLWEQSYANNSRFLSSTSNGQGLAQSFSWTLARNNSHGVNGGGSNNANPFYCDAHQTGYPCNEADDSGWSHTVLTQEGTTTLTAYIGSAEEVQTTGDSTQTTTYYTVAGMRVAANVNGTFDYFGYDALGSQVVVLNSSGTIIGSHLYGPYGNPRYSTGTLPTSIGFTGQQTDSVTGLDYYVARYYDPVVGVFLSPDVVQGNGAGMDPYAYVSGNPETLTDPTGNCGVDSWGDLGSCFTQAVQAVDTVASDIGGAIDGAISDIGGAVSDAVGAVVSSVEDLGPGIGIGLLIAQALSQHTSLGCGCVASTTADARSIAGNMSAPRAWDQQEQKELAQDLARDAAKGRTAAIATYNRTGKGQNPHGSNAATGLLTITVGGKVMVYTDFELGYAGAPPSKHAEQLIVNWAIGILGSYRGSLQGAVISLLIFSQTPVCPGCMSQLTSNTWLNQLYAATGLPGGQAEVNLAVWETDPDPSNISGVKSACEGTTDGITSTSSC